MPLSLTLGTSYPVNLEIKNSWRKVEANIGSQLISIGAKVADDFELILNGRYYGFTAQTWQRERFNLTSYTLGIGYLF